MELGGKHNRAIGILLISVIFSGILGYMILEGMSFIESLYMTIITISTVGFGEVKELSDAGRLFTIILIMAGLATVAYGFRNLAAFVLEGEFRKALRRRKMENKLTKLHDHVIVCGAGQTGQIVIEQFQRRNVSFVVIENDESKVEELLDKDVIALLGDASDEGLLMKAKITDARGLVACLANDADNVFVVLTARELNDDVYIVARAIERNSHLKLRKAGANNTISPNELGGARLAALMLKPAVVSFLDVITHVGEVDLDLEEVHICSGSAMAGETLKDASIPQKTGLVVLAIKKKGEEQLRFNPGLQEVLQVGDKMIVLGEVHQIDTLRRLACE